MLHLLISLCNEPWCDNHTELVQTSRYSDWVAGLNTVDQESDSLQEQNISFIIARRLRDASICCPSPCKWDRKQKVVDSISEEVIFFQFT
jgi:hypothetical protein